MSFPSEEQLDEAGLRVDVDGPVLTVTLNRPDQRNAQTPSMWRALAAIGDALDPEIRVAVVKGVGPTFSAGLDRRMMTPDGITGEPTFPEIAAMPDADADALISRFQAGFGWWRRPEIVSVAAVQGAAVGAGFQLALACDLRVIADDARFCMREPALGLVPDLGGTKPLVEAVGYARAMELCATARWMDADEAVATGLATASVAGDQGAPRRGGGPHVRRTTRRRTGGSARATETAREPPELSFAADPGSVTPGKGMMMAECSARIDPGES